VTSAPLTSIDDISPGWLTDVLRVGGYLTSGTVTDIKVRSSKSQNSGNAYIRLTYSPVATGECPARLFLKLCDPGNDSFGDAEIVYYTTIAHAIRQPPLPRCYHAAYLSGQGRYHLLLEDLSETHASQRQVKPTLANAMKTVEAMACLHAAWWDHPQLPSISEMPTRAKLEKYLSFVRAGLAPMLADAGAELPQEWVDLIVRIFDMHPQKMIERAQAGREMTCIHGDPNPGNILSPIGPEGRVYLIDRQPFDWSLTIWLGVSDLAYMMVHWWESEIRREWEKPLVEHYQRQLTGLGVRNYTFEQCWRDYRLCAMQSLYVASAWCVDAAERQAYRWVWLPQLRKTMAACIDLQCMELLH
jgi:thiamine kinase-like enzyme